MFFIFVFLIMKGVNIGRIFQFQIFKLKLGEITPHFGLKYPVGNVKTATASYTSEKITVIAGRHYYSLSALAGSNPYPLQSTASTTPIPIASHQPTTSQPLQINEFPSQKRKFRKTTELQ